MPRHKDALEDHLKRGTYRQDRMPVKDNAFSLELLSVTPTIPVSLTDCTLACHLWRKVLPPLVRSKRLAKEDVPFLEQVFAQCRVIEALDTFIAEAIAKADLDGLIKAADGRNRQVKTLIEFLKKFGVTARGRQDIFASLSALNAKEDEGIGDLLDDGEDD